MTKKNQKVRVLAIVLVAAMLLSIVGASITSFAATATVGGTNVNVREQTSTGSSVVGTANTGDTFEVGEPETASDGTKWYKVTLSNGNSGYIRSDLLSVSEDTESSAETPAPTSEAEPAPTSAEEPEATVPEETPQESEKYQLVNVPDASGNDVWYVYDYEDGLRIKVEDLSQYDTIKSNADKYEKSAGRYRTILIIFGVLLLAMLAALAFLIMRLRDAMSHDVDIAKERRAKGRARGSAAGTAAADGKEVRRPGIGTGRAKAGRGDRPYASRPGADSTARSTERSSVERPARPMTGTRPSGRPTARPAAGTRPVQGTPARRPSGDSLERAVEGRPSGTVRRPVGEDSTARRRPAAPRNFAADDDLDYGFLNKKE